MHGAGSSIIPMFEVKGKREKILASGALDEWLENVRIWIPNMLILNRQTWLSESQSSGKNDGGDEEEERRSDSVMKVADNGMFSKETVVPNSIMSKTMNSLEVDRMWEGNKMVDWRVIKSDSGMQRRILV
ncbi:hypothetical protein V6N13_059557 [Hibiscus sabdariffa]|uniref:Uncharacterized protein n=1 Tax=Hibiscus sabdariffa TaxID=183260 RepID=A0ABR2GDB8_9ROSI